MRGLIARFTAGAAERRDRERRARVLARGVSPSDQTEPPAPQDRTYAKPADPKEVASRRHPDSPSWIAQIHNDIG